MAWLGPGDKRLAMGERGRGKGRERRESLSAVVEGQR